MEGRPRPSDFVFLAATPQEKAALDRIISSFEKLINEIHSTRNCCFEYATFSNAKLLVSRVLVGFYCNECMRRVAPMSANRRQTFRFSLMLASFFSRLVENSANLQAARVGGEVLAAL